MVELEDLTRFDKVFYISAETEYGIEDLKQYLESIAMDSPEVKDHIDTVETCTFFNYSGGGINRSSA